MERVKIKVKSKEKNYNSMKHHEVLHDWINFYALSWNTGMIGKNEEPP